MSYYWNIDHGVAAFWSRQKLIPRLRIPYKTVKIELSKNTQKEEYVVRLSGFLFAGVRAMADSVTC